MNLQPRSTLSNAQGTICSLWSPSERLLPLLRTLLQFQSGQEVALCSWGRARCFHDREIREKHGTCCGFSISKGWRDGM